MVSGFREWLLKKYFPLGPILKICKGVYLMIIYVHFGFHTMATAILDFRSAHSH